MLSVGAKRLITGKISLAEQFLTTWGKTFPPHFFIPKTMFFSVLSVLRAATAFAADAAGTEIGFVGFDFTGGEARFHGGDIVNALAEFLIEAVHGFSIYARKNSGF